MRPIRVLLADDEPIIIRGLKKLIAWEALGLSIVGEARDGKELKQLINNADPDLIISDISMPGFTGIDIIRDIHESGRPIKVVFISAYQEFDYARQAIQYGALDYLVKPVNTGQLEQVLSRAVAAIREESEGERNKLMLNHYEQKNRSVTIEELLEQLADGNRSRAAEFIRMAGRADRDFVTVCVVETDEYDGQSSRWKERERKLVTFALSNIIKETVEAHGNGYVFRKGERFGILLQHDAPGEPLPLMQDLHGKINAFLKLKVSVGIGRSVHDIEHIDESYTTALKALTRRYFAGLNQVYAYSGEVEVPGEYAQEELKKLQEQLIETLQSLEYDKLTPLLHRLLETLKQQAEGSRGKAVSSTYNVILQLEQEFAGYGIEARIQDGLPQPLLEMLHEAPTFEQLGFELEQAVSRIAELLAGKIKGRDNVQLSRVKAHVEQHYADNITLESVSAMVYMNPYYFSSFFKKHTGQNFKNYVTEVRMRHALRLLLESDLMVYEIADRVGYNNARHFSDMFKRKFGKLPQEYKQSYRNS
ncbi:Protein-glutamate methylesterase/protein-glutamine glutaminase [Paenibacillus auburnensis]|uniref:Protein-glutamate methylesterase/protein-glutamine glutaminase n=1 Tax=Paenibacillus auburnensis TaxID=2905649 RepID=A0ABM9BV94_9BACL|nr:response regulator [Paenibacillus auburnensis]CAH1195541.1 Protein-glutamate methylesterase/protein-glutamine glutaminase [Paenibacillus auburnensis]